jgi:hypothetical protein
MLRPFKCFMIFGIKMCILEFDSLYITLAIYCSKCFVKYTCRSVVFNERKHYYFLFSNPALL